MQTVIFVVSSHGREKVREFSGVLYTRVLISFMRALCSALNHCGAPPPNAINWDAMILVYKFEGEETFSPLQSYRIYFRLCRQKKKKKKSPLQLFNSSSMAQRQSLIMHIIYINICVAIRLYLKQKTFRFGPWVGFCQLLTCHG